MKAKRKIERLITKILELSAKKLNVALAVASGFFLIIASLFYIWSISKYEASLTEQMLHRQQLIARSGANSIEHLINATSDSIGLLSGNDGLLDVGKRQYVLDTYLAHWKHFSIVGVFLTDNEGKIVANSSNVGSVLVGQSVADRKYYKDTISTDKNSVFISKPFIADKGSVAGKKVISFNTKIYDKNGNYSGVLTSIFLLSDILETYITPLKISQDTEISFLTSDGVYWYSEDENVTGKSIHDIIDTREFPDKKLLSERLTNDLLNAKEGKMDISLPDFFDSGNNETSRYLIAYSPVYCLDGCKMYLIITNPAEDAFEFSNTYTKMNTFMILVVVATVVSFSLFVILVVRLVQRDAYIEGYIYGRDQMVNKPK